MNSRSRFSRSRAGSTEPAGCGCAGVVPGPDDVDQRVRVAQPGEVLGRQLLGAHVALGATPAAPAGPRR